jgi:hypothetical protein
MEGNQPDDWQTWKIKQLRKDIDSINDPKKKLMKIPPNNPWGIDPMLFPDGVTKETYQQLVDGVYKRDMKKIKDDEEADKVIMQVAKEKGLTLGDDKPISAKSTAELNQSKTLFKNLDNIDREIEKMNQLQKLEQQQKQQEDTQLYKDLEEVYVNYKGNYMRSMIQYIQYDKFIECYHEDMDKVEDCLYMVKSYLENKQDKTDKEKVILYTIESIVYLYKAIDIDKINTIYTNWYNYVTGNYKQGASAFVGGKKKKSGGKKTKKRKYSKKP